MEPWPMDGGRTGLRATTDRSDFDRRHHDSFPFPSPLSAQPRTATSPPGLALVAPGLMAARHHADVVARAKDTAMIYSTIERQGDEFVAAISDEDMEAHGLREGDRIMFHPVKLEDGRTELRPEIQEAFDESWEQNESGYRYLKDR